MLVHFMHLFTALFGANAKCRFLLNTASTSSTPEGLSCKAALSTSWVAGTAAQCCASKPSTPDSTLACGNAIARINTTAVSSLSSLVFSCAVRNQLCAQTKSDLHQLITQTRQAGMSLNALTGLPLSSTTQELFSLMSDEDIFSRAKPYFSSTHTRKIDKMDSQWGKQDDDAADINVNADPKPTPFTDVRLPPPSPAPTPPRPTPRPVTPAPTPVATKKKEMTRAEFFRPGGANDDDTDA
jgi:hypothetical protein